MTFKEIRIGIVQENPVVGDIKGNLELVFRSVDRLKGLKPDIVLFSEMFLTGYPPEDLLLREDLFQTVDLALDEIAKEHPELYLILGYPRKKNNKIYNTAGCIYQGEIQAEYFKQELPNYKVFDEKRYFDPGKEPCLVSVKDHILALTICEDIWYTRAIRQATRRGAEIVLNLNASPFHRNKFQERKQLLMDHVKKFSVPIVYVNQVGGQDELVFDGSSLVVMPSSGIEFQLPSFETCTEVIEFQSKNSEIRLARKRRLGKRRGLQDIYEALVLGTRDYVEKNGFRGVVIGSSGGIDSALTTTIAVEALGNERVRTVMMPYKFTAEMSIYDAQELANNLGIDHQVIEIHDIYDAFKKSLQVELESKRKSNAEENLQSRCRGVLLMAISNKSGYLVLTTGNKSETAVGYSTLYGDTAGGFAVLKDVPKTLVYELANYRNSISNVIPKRIIERPPSAELSPNQRDCDSLPDYSILDKIIELYVEKDMSLATIVEKGFEGNMVKSVLKLIDNSEYKRRQAPPGVRITERGFGKDRRYPITNRYSQ